MRQLEMVALSVVWGGLLFMTGCFLRLAYEITNEIENNALGEGKF